MKINPLAPKWQHNDPKIRLRSVLTGKLSPEVLAQLASEDPDSAVQRAAIELLQDHNVLFQLATTDNPVRSEAAARWATLVGDDLSHIEVVDENLPQPLVTAIAMHAPQEDFRLRATEQLADEAALLDILFADNFSRVHQHCVTRLTSESSLKEAQKHFLDRDKNVSRIAKSKLQVIHQARAEQEAAEAVLNELRQKLTQLVTSERNPDYGRRVDALKHQWLTEANGPFAAPYKTDITQLIEQCEEIAETIPDPAEIRRQQMTELVQRCQELTARCQATPQLDGLPEQLNNILNDWPEDESELRQQWTAPLTALVNVNRRWQVLLAKRTSMDLAKLKTELASLSWPEGFAQPADFDEVAKQVESELKDLSEQQAARQATDAELEQLIGKLDLEVTAGHIKAANRASAKLNSLLATARPTGEQSSRIQQLLTKLQELKDWQGFATQPKRNELCEKMQHLAEDVAIAPPEKARAIKELQDEWKKLGPSDSRAAQKSWSQFKKLGDKAFEPCAAYFAEQEKLRLQNLAEREKICASLELVNAEHDWSTTDWKAMADIVHKAKSEWRRFTNVPRRDKKTIERRFDQALGPIQKRLQEHQDANVTQKRGLIQEVEDLLAAETDTHKLVQATKRIQQRWKDVGHTDRRQDQKLWKAFRHQCDAVFKRRDEATTAAKTAASEAANQFRALCQSFAQQLDSDTAIDRGDIAAFRKSTAAVNIEPPQKSLQNEAAKLIKQAERQLKQQTEANQEQMFREFQRRCQLLDQADAGEITLQDAEAAFDANTTLDRDLAKALGSRVQRDIDEQERIIIRLEIISDLPSPESSQAKRMAFQVERLNRELSQGIKETRSEREQVQALLLEWFTTRQKAASLVPRFGQVAIKLGLPV